MTRPTTRAIAIAIGAAVLTLGVGIATIPQPPQLSTETTGDDELVAHVRDLLAATPGVRSRVSVAVIDADGVREAHFGATDATEYEIGSVTKTMTGSLLAESIARGEVTPQTRLGDLLELGSSDAASITLEALATHTSGLPRLAPSAAQLVSALIANYSAGDPYGATVDELVASARETQLGEREFLYSNFGFALLGQALASAAGTDYPALVRDRVLDPLAMDDSFAPTTVDDLAEGAPTGYTASGRPSAAWTLGADAPAGSVRSTLADMVDYVGAQLDGTAPGVVATEPLADIGESGAIGYAWITTEGVTWHNGGTGGFTSWVGFDRDAGRAVVVLNSTTTSVDELGFALMGGE